MKLTFSLCILFRIKYGFLRFANHCIVSVWTVCQAVCDPVQDSEDQEYNSKKCSIAKLQQIYEDKLDQRKKIQKSNYSQKRHN